MWISADDTWLFLVLGHLWIPLLLENGIYLAILDRLWISIVTCPSADVFEDISRKFMDNNP